MTSRPSNSGHRDNSEARRPIDPLLFQRLEELGNRRAGAPLPPPSPGSAKQTNARTANAKNTTARTAPTKHAPNKPGAGRGAAGAQADKLNAALARSAAARAGVATGAKPVGRRAKPAASSKVAALALSVATTAALAGLFAHQDSTTDSVILTGGTALPAADPTAVPATTVPGAVAPNTVAPTTAAPVSANGTIADGTYVGGASQNRFGTVQVQAVYSGGQLTDVQILQYPDGDRRSLQISQYAIPKLITSAISAQSASINGVSGATYTSRSYAASLQSAIDAAKSASGVTG